ncbi:hypothetical protein CCM_06291 [Cordyceps militaris CM01]|uniref:Uncharacterized protein n=2 Tax=Cordyceps militaris TaxID=73501 RepID=G3JJU7_CORMM|nr:uncharacterized protein CCM_06291 [Cordyceps militaris CM01]EGX92131.1 hypothetical protein CCM_06291 [Cordyceps militaris CM01]
MRFTALLALGAAVVVSAQSATTSAAAPASSQETCLKNCGTDVVCRAHCAGVPVPDEGQVNDTTQCAMKCPQGDGSPSDTQKYSDCVQGCISQHFFNSQSGTPSATGGSGAGAAAGSSVTATASSSSAAVSSASSAAGSSASSAAHSSASSAASSASKTAEASQSSTSASASATATKNAAAGLTGVSATLLGFVAALFALGSGYELLVNLVS